MLPGITAVKGSNKLLDFNGNKKILTIKMQDGALYSVFAIGHYAFDSLFSRTGHTQFNPGRSWA